MSLTRSVAGRIFASSFSTAALADWTVVGSNWTVDTSLPTFVAYSSSIVQIIATPASADASGCREGKVTVMDSGVIWVHYDAGDGTNPWQYQSASSADGGVTFTKHGVLGGLTHGSHASVYTASPPFRRSSTWYFYMGTADAFSGSPADVPAVPYPSQIYTASDIDGTAMTWVRDIGVGTSGAYDDNAHLLCAEIDDGGGGFISYVDAFKFGGVYSIGRSTASSLSGAWTDFGASILHANISISGNNPENPSYIDCGTSLGKAVLICNNVDISGGFTNANVAYYAASENGWSASTAYTYRLQVVGLDGNQSIGCGAPWFDELGVAKVETDGAVGLTWDDNKTNDATSGHHHNRQVRQGHLYQSKDFGKYTAPTPGTIAAVDVLLKNLSHTDLFLTFTSEVADVTNSTTTNLWQLFLRADGSNPASNTAYIFNITAAGGVDLFKQSAGTPGAPVASGSYTPSLAIDGHNYQYDRVRAQISGSGTTVIKLYVENTLVINYSDSSSPITSGTYFGFTGAGNVTRFRNFTACKSNTVTSTGWTPSAAVSLCGASGAIFDTQTADGGGSVTLTSSWWPMYSLMSNASYTRLAAGNGYDSLLWGGDTVVQSVNSPSSTPSNTPSSTPSHTPSPSSTPSSTSSSTPSHTPSHTASSTPSSTHTQSSTPSSTQSSTPSHTPSPPPSGGLCNIFTGVIVRG